MNNKATGLGVTCSTLPSPRVSLTPAKKQTVMLEEYKTRAWLHNRRKLCVPVSPKDTSLVLSTLDAELISPKTNQQNTPQFKRLSNLSFALLYRESLHSKGLDYFFSFGKRRYTKVAFYWNQPLVGVGWTLSSSIWRIPIWTRGLVD